MPPPPTERITFGRWQRSDVDQASRLWCDPRVMHYLGGPYTREEVVERLEREIANDEALGVQYWPLFIDGDFAGCCGLKPCDGGLEIGFHLLPQFWRSGYASEAARAVIAYAFDELHASALYAGHHPENDASRALLERLGFTQIGTHYFARTALQHAWCRLLP